MNEELEPVTTSDTPFAAYLFYHNHKFVGFVEDKHDRRSLIFAFVKQENTDLLTDDYYEGDPMVHPRKYYAMTKKAHKALHDYKDSQGVK